MYLKSDREIFNNNRTCWEIFNAFSVFFLFASRRFVRARFLSCFCERFFLIRLRLLNVEPPKIEVYVSVTLCAADTKTLGSNTFGKIKQTLRREALGQKQSATSRFNSVLLFASFRLLFFVVGFLSKWGRTSRTSQSSRHKLFCLFAFTLHTNTNGGNSALCFEEKNKSLRFVRFVAVVFISDPCIHFNCHMLVVCACVCEQRHKYLWHGFC